MVPGSSRSVGFSVNRSSSELPSSASTSSPASIFVPSVSSSTASSSEAKTGTTDENPVSSTVATSVNIAIVFFNQFFLFIVFSFADPLLSVSDTSALKNAENRVYTTLYY